MRPKLLHSAILVIPESTLALQRCIGSSRARGNIGSAAAGRQLQASEPHRRHRGTAAKSGFAASSDFAASWRFEEHRQYRRTSAATLKFEPASVVGTPAASELGSTLAAQGHNGGTESQQHKVTMAAQKHNSNLGSSEGLVIVQMRRNPQSRLNRY